MSCCLLSLTSAPLDRELRLFDLPTLKQTANSIYCPATGIVSPLIFSEEYTQENPHESPLKPADDAYCADQEVKKVQKPDYRI